MIMNDKWLRFYRLITRLLCPFCVAISPLIFYDLFAPATEIDDAIITGKTTYYQRGKDLFTIEARGRYTYMEGVSPIIYRTTQIGDTLRVSLSPIFSEWKNMELIRSGTVLITTRGSDLYWMGAIGILFLISLAAFLPERILFSHLLLVIALPVINLIGLLLWLRFVLLWTGQIDKM